MDTGCDGLQLLLFDGCGKSGVRSFVLLSVCCSSVATRLIVVEDGQYNFYNSYVGSNRPHNLITDSTHTMVRTICNLMRARPKQQQLKQGPNQHPQNCRMALKGFLGTLIISSFPSSTYLWGREVIFYIPYNSISAVHTEHVRELNKMCGIESAKTTT